MKWTHASTPACPSCGSKDWTIREDMRSRDFSYDCKECGFGAVVSGFAASRGRVQSTLDFAFIPPAPKIPILTGAGPGWSG